MIKDNERIFTNLYSQHGEGFAVAKSLGAFDKLDYVLNKQKSDIIEEVKASGLKGRGGAGFPTGLKWSFVKKNPTKPTYLVINADEGEPGTCKDREIIRNEPYKIIEGIIIASYALDVNTCYIYVRGEFYEEAQKLQEAIDECYKQKLLGENCLDKYSLDIYIHLGAGAYVCGEESALLESLEGKKGFPRLKPPFPATCGLYGCPTVINNVETIASIPAILKNGAKWYEDLGTSNSAGTKLFCISGAVNNPCVVEEKLGIPLKTLIEKYAGGVKGGWDNLYAIIPGGNSAPILPATLCQNLNMDFDSVKAAGSALGTGGIIVFDKGTNILDIMYNVVSFYMHESCGQCTPCREGSSAVVKIINKIRDKKAVAEDIEAMSRILEDTFGKSICGLHDATVFAVRGFLKHYKKDLQSYMQ